MIDGSGLVAGSGREAAQTLRKASAIGGEPLPVARAATMPNMRSFSERLGLRAPRTVAQVASIDDELRNGLWSILHLQFWQFRTSPYVGGTVQSLLVAVWVGFLKRPADTFRIEPGLAELRELFFNWPWNQVYDLVEFVANAGLDAQQRFQYLEACNAVLARDLAGYRFVEGELVPIATEEELSAIEQARRDAGAYGPVREHLRQAASLLADRANPDFRNSVKESISAVEAACGIVTDRKGSLGECLKLLGREDALHPAFRDALSKLYGWSSDAQGIRHALMDAPSLDLADARFMLVVCSAFVSYLLGKTT